MPEQTKQERAEELKKMIDDIDEELFMIDMIDRWSESDRVAYTDLTDLKERLQIELNELDGGNENGDN